MMTPQNALQHLLVWCLEHPGKRVHVGFRQVVCNDVPRWAREVGLECAPGVRRVGGGKGKPGWWVWKREGGESDDVS